MPTGYTSGVLDGKINSFPEFAKICMRAFGATIHMRDEDLDKEYTPRTPSDYYVKRIEELNERLKDAQELSDKDLIAKKRKELEKSKEYHLNAIKEAKANAEKLNVILKDVRKWDPPTSEHTEFKTFMEKQILSTLDFDCKTDYHEKELNTIDHVSKNLDAKLIRRETMEEVEKDLERCVNEHKKDVQRCEDSNKWVTELMESLSTVTKE